MREQRNDPKRLKDILQAIDTIFEYVEGRGMEDFIADKRSYHAVIYNIMIIGEAANMLTFEFREAHSDLKWRQITNMRNFLIFATAFLPLVPWMSGLVNGLQNRQRRFESARHLAREREMTTGSFPFCRLRRLP